MTSPARVLSSLYDSDDGLGASEVPGSPWRPERAAFESLGRRHAAAVAHANRMWARQAREMRLRAQSEAGVASINVQAETIDDVRCALLGAVPPELIHCMAPFDARAVDYLVRSLEIAVLRALVDDIATTVAAMRVLESARRVARSVG